MLQQSGLIKAFWGEAIGMANYLQNRTPTKSINIDKTHYKLWMGYNPNLSHLNIFGCTAYALIQIDHGKKLDFHSNLPPHPSSSNRPQSPITRTKS